MAIKIYTSRMIREDHPEERIISLVTEFRNYKEKGILPDTFGRDYPYHRPSAAVNADLRHIHLNPMANWNLRVIQHKRSSDTCLVYCSGWHSGDNYLLIAILSNAHERAQKITFMMELAEIAEGFRKKY